MLLCSCTCQLNVGSFFFIIFISSDSISLSCLAHLSLWHLLLPHELTLCLRLQGMNWLADLYNQGINGILADEMGLGKTVQSIAFLAHVAEVHGIWGPFLVVAPASTLHNWQQEAARFLPKMRVVPYWGTTQERKVSAMYSLKIYRIVSYM